MTKILAQFNDAVMLEFDPLKPNITPLFTAQLQTAFVRNDKRPIIFRSGVTDIVRKEDTFRIYFGSKPKTERRSWRTWLNSLRSRSRNAQHPNVNFVLECGQEEVTMIVDNYPSEYAVVAHITSVRRASDEAVTQEDGQQHEYFEAAGKCVDLLALKENYTQFIANEGIQADIQKDLDIMMELFNKIKNQPTTEE